MKYVYVTRNTQQDIDTMNGYAGTSLLYSETDFCVWLWVNPVQTDLQATQGVNSSVNVIATTMINIV